MKQINVSNWGYFHIYDIFNIDMGTKLDMVKMKILNPQINFVGRASTNNGVTGKVDLIKNIKPYNSGSMTLALGGSYLGSCFIQDEPFYTSQNVIVLSPKENISDYAKRFIATAIRKESSLHYRAFIDELNSHIKTDFKFKLPITKDNIPDYEYMSNYMKIIEKKISFNLSSMKNIKKTNRKIDVKSWRKFYIKDLFTVNNTRNILSRDIIPNSGNTPYLTATENNNSVTSYISYDMNLSEKGNAIFIGGKTLTVTYQKEDFFSNDSHNIVLRFKQDISLSEDGWLFLVSALYKSLKPKYSWTDSISKKKIIEEVILLPSTPENYPDWIYIENYMKLIKTKTNTKIDNLLAATKK
ncbi:restriction endonuclease subunit S [Clostridium perfringens]|uniref:restriction endonuclease subunit S n=1 Tax=Clostridium perfringens TaxID=1502 RepID=UPI000D70B50F|nr:restriction endonuclease subunit S [Clostridium perfringens]MDM0635712.1 restriction endonuclease subunit S [Clostridium perfringens]NGT31821.1 hypothetical protein [Clostridium perfringens]NGU09541.1 hypothetical protein [Clostridium perfringens]